MATPTPPAATRAFRAEHLPRPHPRRPPGGGSSRRPPARRSRRAGDRAAPGAWLPSPHSRPWPAIGDVGGHRRGQAALALEGPLVPDLDPAELARRYEAGGAACLSVLTDVEFFGGSPGRPRRRPGGRARCRCCARTSPSIARDVCDARLMGADCVLLIAAALDQAELESFLAPRPAPRPRRAGRDPRRGRARAGRGRRRRPRRGQPARPGDVRGRHRPGRPHGPADARRASCGWPSRASRGPDDARVLAAAGYHAVLVGEHLVTSGDPAAGVAALRAASRRAVTGEGPSDPGPEQVGAVRQIHASPTPRS